MGNRPKVNVEPSQKTKRSNRAHATSANGADDCATALQPHFTIEADSPKSPVDHRKAVVAPLLPAATQLAADLGITAEEAEKALSRRSTEDRARAMQELEIAEHALALSPDIVCKVSKRTDAVDAGLALNEQMTALAPTDEIERMLVVQMIAMNGLALSATKRAHNTDMQAHYVDYVNAANKASRTFAALAETLARHRGKTSEQKVTVEHVHVHEGGQAIVGHVAVPPGRGRARSKKEALPHE